jgi:hypothetical protein
MTIPKRGNASLARTSGRLPIDHGSRRRLP